MRRRVTGSYLSLMSVVVAVLVLGTGAAFTPVPSHAAWIVELGGGIGMEERSPFVKGSVAYDLGHDGWFLVPGANAVLSAAQMELNVSLTGGYRVTERLAVLAGIEGGLGLTADVYCHLAWLAGVGTDSGATRIAIVGGAESRRVWRCEVPSGRYLGMQLWYAPEGRPALGIQIRSPFDAQPVAPETELAVRWRF